MSVLNGTLHTAFKIVSKKGKGSARPVPTYVCSRVLQENFNAPIQQNAEHP